MPDDGEKTITCLSLESYVVLKVCNETKNKSDIDRDVVGYTKVYTDRIVLLVIRVHR